MENDYLIIPGLRTEFYTRIRYNSEKVNELAMKRAEKFVSSKNYSSIFEELEDRVKMHLVNTKCSSPEKKRSKTFTPEEMQDMRTIKY